MVSCEGEVYETEDPGADPGSVPDDEPWDPSLYVVLDRETGEYVIDQIAFEDLKLDPAPLRSDSSELRELESGYYQLAASGTLADALGWEAGDVLLSVNGYNLGGLAEFAAAYTDLADHTQFTFTMQRGQREVELYYRVE